MDKTSQMMRNQTLSSSKSRKKRKLQITKIILLWKDKKIRMTIITK